MSLRRRTFVVTGLAGAFASSAACSRGRAAPSTAQEVRPNLYVCEGCEATAERNPDGLSWSVILAGPDEPGERMRLSGRVYTPDGVTPKPGVVIYAHHTNADGLYANGSSETEWSRRHGRLRGWARTNADGDYVFETIKPAPYPDRTGPAHVHLFIQEPGRPPYYIDDVVFDGEFRVDEAYRARQELRGGSGIVRLGGNAASGWTAVRDIRLEPHPA